MEDPCGGDPECVAPGDADGDGVIDPLDELPDDAAESGDADGDGIGDNADDDVDGDGVPNDADERPLTPDVTIVDTVPEVVVVGRPTSFPLVGESPYGAVLVFALESAPPGATTDGATVTWTPAAPGVQSFTIAADDGLATVRRTLTSVAIAGAPAASALIGAAGGTVEVTDGASPAFGARLVIPPGALDGDTMISISSVDSGGATIEPIPDAPAPPESLLLLEPDGLRFAASAELRFPAALAGDAFTDPASVVAFALGPGASDTFRPELVRLDADGSWVADIIGFSAFGVAENARVERRTLISGPTDVDRRAQELAVQCANRLACGICRRETTACGAWAAMARCLFDAYRQASEEVRVDTGALLTAAPVRYLASFYDLSVDPALKFRLLGLLGESGPAGARPHWLKIHEDGHFGTGFRILDPDDPDPAGGRTGRHDHFATNARLPPATWVAEALVGDSSTTDLRVNALGRAFGMRVLARVTWGGAEIERWLRTNLCDTIEPTPPMTCEGGTGPGGCCPPPSESPCQSCVYLTDCGYCDATRSCEVASVASCSSLRRVGIPSEDLMLRTREINVACMTAPPVCSPMAGSCGASGPMCCTGLECVLGNCYDCAGRGRVGETCDPGSTTACCGAVACAQKSSATDYRCCLRDTDPCTTSADCCGQMQCVAGACRCQSRGQPCLSGRECCGGGICDAGVCT